MNLGFSSRMWQQSGAEKTGVRHNSWYDMRINLLEIYRTFIVYNRPPNSGRSSSQPQIPLIPSGLRDSTKRPRSPRNGRAWRFPAVLAGRCGNKVATEDLKFTEGRGWCRSLAIGKEARYAMLGHWSGRGARFARRAGDDDAKTQHDLQKVLRSVTSQHCGGNSLDATDTFFGGFRA